MQITRWMACLLAAFSLSNSTLAASAVKNPEQIQLPNCLAEELNLPHTVLAQSKDFQIVELNFNDLEKLVLLTDKVHCGHFINLSPKLSGLEAKAKKSLAKQLLNQPKLALAQRSTKTKYAIRHQTEVFNAINEVKQAPIMATVTEMTGFKNRSATKQTGIDAAYWLKKTFAEMVEKNQRLDVDSYFVKTGPRYIQPSLVTVIGKDLKGPAVVVGAHLDTLSGLMPGAGDDASGSASLMEMARILLESKQVLKRPVYLIWYAAEERGLIGSQYVVADFKQKKIPVKAAIQLDMTGFRNDVNDPTIWVYQDYTDPSLNDFIAELIQTYVGVPVGYSACGYGCSDHASWMEANVPAAFPCETDFEHHNPYIHSSEDTMDRLVPEHMVNFTKLGLAFAIELAAN